MPNSSKTKPALIDPAAFNQTVLTWYDQHGRKHLPWQQHISPYRVWVSEIMLQQTQVTTVIPYFERFMQRFPTIADLAAATQDEVLHHWTGLGYYARGRNLHKCAQVICTEHAGDFPKSVDALIQLPGIGRSTAGAIASISMNIEAPILDGNVKRVLTRFYAIEGWPGTSTVEKNLWEIATTLTPNHHHREYTQAMMDLGATLCTRSKPACGICPLLPQCQGHKTGKPTQFPNSKPKKEKPSKETVLVMVKNPKGEWLLQQRPQQGIWGGLWSFPEVASVDDALTWVEQVLNGKSEHIETLATFRHTFSHYHLYITPVAIHLASLPAAVREAADHWYNPMQPSALGLAAPVKTLLNTLQKDAP
ncbi:MAG: A/G-specific adenine glycosylase [Oleibacter sp.]|nr:A/G-specific adenine glycosylase [Thalassolituus sp.]